MVQCLVKNLYVGQRVDLEGDVFADPDVYAADGDPSVSEHPEFQFEFQTVMAVVVESADCTRVDFESGFSCGFDPDHAVDVDGEQVRPEPETLPVIFRAERSGDFKGHVTAVFPTLPGTDRYDFTVYAHIGQHGTGSKPWYNATRAATPEEYGDLLRELRRIYESSPPGNCEPVTLVLAKRFTQAHDKARAEACRR